MQERDELTGLLWPPKMLCRVVFEEDVSEEEFCRVVDAIGSEIAEGEFVKFEHPWDQDSFVNLWNSNGEPYHENSLWRIEDLSNSKERSPFALAGWFFRQTKADWLEDEKYRKIWEENQKTT